MSDISVKELVALMRWNAEFEGWTKESILKHLEYTARKYSGAEVASAVRAKEREMKAQKEALVRELERRNRDYGLLLARHSKLKKTLRDESIRKKRRAEARHQPMSDDAIEYVKKKRAISPLVDAAVTAILEWAYYGDDVTPREEQHLTLGLDELVGTLVEFAQTELRKRGIEP